MDIEAGKIIFVVTRESIEALLVVGILWAWVARNPAAARAKNYIIGGIVAGLALAAALAVALRVVNSELGQTAQTIFITVLLLVASGTIVQMVLWMREHARSLKKEMETHMEESVSKQHWWGVFTLTTIAIGREGSETVLFLSSNVAQISTLTQALLFLFYTLIGMVLALCFFYLLQVGNRFISWRIFFRVTEILLLFLGASLVMQAFGALYSNIIPHFAQNVSSGTFWDVYGWFQTAILPQGVSTFLTTHLPENGGVGGFLSSILCYRSNPAIIDLLAFVLYWVVVVSVFAWRKKVIARRQASPNTLSM